MAMRNYLRLTIPMFNRSQMRIFRIATQAIMPVLLISGCNIRPDLQPPGDIYKQRFDAVLHDPFPSDQLGPTIEGARPLEYDRPMDETTNLQTSPFAQPFTGSR